MIAISKRNVINLTGYLSLLRLLGRAFSPASELHELYKNLIWYYSTIQDDIDDLTMLDYADNYLMDRGYDPLPNSFIAKSGK